MIWMRERYRSQTSTSYYDFLRNDPTIKEKLEVHVIQDSKEGVPLEIVCKEMMNGMIPDFVMDGYGSWAGSIKSADFIKNNGIGMIRVIGDPERQAGMQGDGFDYDMFNNIVNVDYIYHPYTELSPRSGMYNNWKSHVGNQMKAKPIYFPFSADPNVYKPAEKKDIDLSFHQTLMPLWPYHRLRWNLKHYFEHIIGDAGKAPKWWTPQDYQEMTLISGLKRSPSGMANDIMYKINTDQYRNVLSRSKITIVDTSQRYYMTSKYVESAMSGCLLMGDKPKGYGDLFSDDCFVEVDFDNAHELGKEVKYYLSHDKKRIEMAKRMRKKMLEGYTNEIIGNNFADFLVAEWNRRPKPGPAKCNGCDHPVDPKDGKNMVFRTKKGIMFACPSCVDNGVDILFRMLQDKNAEEKKDVDKKSP